MTLRQSLENLLESNDPNLDQEINATIMYVAVNKNVHSYVAGSPKCVLPLFLEVSQTINKSIDVYLDQHHIDKGKFYDRLSKDFKTISKEVQ